MRFPTEDRSSVLSLIRQTNREGLLARAPLRIQARHLLVRLLPRRIDAGRVGAALEPQVHQRERLVGEAIGDHALLMAVGTVSSGLAFASAKTKVRLVSAAGDFTTPSTLADLR